MTGSVAILRNAVARLADAVDRGARPSIDAEVENVAAVTVGLVATSDSEAFMDVLPDVERLYSTTLVGDGEADDRDDAVVGQIGTLVTLFSVASSRPGRSSVEGLVGSGINARLIRVLSTAEGPLDNQQLAERIGCAEETVARALPELRAAGLVLCTRQWRRKMNELTSRGHEAAGKSAPAAEAAGTAAAPRGFDFAHLVAGVMTEGPRRVDIEQVATACGAIVVERAGQTASGHIVAEPPGKQGRPSFTLTVDPQEFGPRKRFTIAHELGHLVMHTAHLGGGMQRSRVARKPKDGRQEAEADRIAAAILVPEIAVIKAYATDPNVQWLARLFDVSEPMMQRRITELNLCRMKAVTADVHTP